MKNLSIRVKITRTFLFVCIITLAVSVTILFLMLFGMRNLLEESGNIAGETAANMSSYALTELAIRDAEELLRVKAELISSDLESSIQTLDRIRNYLTVLYANPASFEEANIPNFRKVNHGILSPHWFLQDGFLENPNYDVRDLEELGLTNELGLLANVIPMISSLMERREDISSIYIQTITGLNVQYDQHAYEKAHFYDMPVLHEREWFVTIQETRERFVSDTYEDSFGRGLCITVAYPVYDSDHNFVAGIGFDILIETFSETINQMVVGTAGYAMLFGHNMLLAAPGLENGRQAEIPEFYNKITEEYMGSFVSIVDDEESFILWNRIPVTDWILVYVLPSNIMYNLADHMRIEISEMTQDVINNANQDFLLLISIVSGILIIVLAAIFVSVDLLAKRISNPIVQLSNDAKRIGKGDLDRVLEANTGDEIEDLASTFNQMVSDIKRITGAKQRISTELELAKKIQTSMLPSTFSVVADRGDLDIYANMIPSTEVGGDFYDFFFIDENTIVVVVADVSGSGVPASLFMVIASTLIRSTSMSGKTPAEVFERVNQQLCEHNLESMFVTSFMAYIHLPTGEVTYVNAGHNPPVIRRNHRWEWLNAIPGFILAGEELMTYKQANYTLLPGDMFLLYTDGVTEETNKKHELYGANRFMEYLNRNVTKEPKEINLGILEEMKNFADGSDQADDITILTLKYIGGHKKQTDSIRTTTDLSNLVEVNEFVEQRIIDFPIEVQDNLGIVIDEIFSNIAKYAYDGEEGSIQVKIRTTTSDVTVEFTDWGNPFNPLKCANPQINVPLEERNEGGLGLYLVRNLMDHIGYNRIKDTNVLTIRKCITSI